MKASAMAAHWPMAQTKQRHSWPSSLCSFGDSCNLSSERRFKIFGYVLVGLTIFATMYTFSRGGYLAVLFGVFVLGLLKDRKLLLVLGVFLLTWQTVVPTAVRERVNMTENANGQLEASAQERVELWKNAEESNPPAVQS